MLHPMEVNQSPVGEPERRGDERSEAPRSGGSPTGERAVAAVPDPEVPAKPQRRRFTAEYRLRILKEADACKKPGELGALLRREGLYSSHLVNWRRQREDGALRDLRARRRGPVPKPVDPRVRQLEAENRRLQRKLQRAETIITLQKKVAEILGIPLKPLDNDESD
jgi:transposase-like protein